MVCLLKAVGYAPHRMKCIRCRPCSMGRPIVAMPFFADQLPNAEKVVAKVRQYATHSG